MFNRRVTGSSPVGGAFTAGQRPRASAVARSMHCLCTGIAFRFLIAHLPVGLVECLGSGAGHCPTAQVPILSHAHLCVPQLIRDLPRRQACPVQFGSCRLVARPTAATVLHCHTCPNGSNGTPMPPTTSVPGPGAIPTQPTSSLIGPPKPSMTLIGSSMNLTRTRRTPTAFRVVDYSQSASIVVTVVALRDQHGVLHGATAWRSNSKQHRRYQEGAVDD